MEKLASPRALRYATDPAYRERIRAAQARRYAESEEFRQSSILRAKLRREAQQRHMHGVREAWQQTEAYRADLAAWVARKKVEAQARSLEWYAKNTARAKLNIRSGRDRNPGRSAHWSVMHRMRKLCRVPPWVDEDAVLRFYECAAVMRKYGDVELHVDHIVPLNHPLVCGLHCQFNLQVTTARHNLTKGNREWPGMPGDDK